MASEGDDSSSSSWMGVLGAGLLSGLLSSQGQKDTNETNIQLGREQMGFQERMSNTAYQRAVGDMAKAGINPMLAAQVGGATTPSGAMPQVQNRVGAGVASAGQAMQTMQAAQQINQSKAQEQELKNSADKIKSETIAQDLNTAKRAAEIEQTKAAAEAARQTAANTREAIKGTSYDSLTKQGRFDAMNAGDGKKDSQNAGFKAEVEKLKAESKSSQYQLSEDKAKADYFGDKKWGQYDPYIRSILGITSGVSSAVRAGK